VLDFEMIAGNPQEFILSAKGNLLGGFLGAALSVGMRLWEDKKEALPEPKEIEVNCSSLRTSRNHHNSSCRVRYFGRQAVSITLRIGMI
jgi:hypothetical protein